MEIDESQFKQSSASTRLNITTDLIQQLNRRQKLVTKSIQQCDVLFVKRKINKSQKKLCQQQVTKQQSHFENYLAIYRQLDEKHQKPYANMVRRFKVKIDNHQKLLIEVQQNKHTLFIDSKKQIWQEEFQSESSILFYSRGILGILGAICLHAIFGAIYRWAMINAYVTSFFKISNDPFIQTSQNSIGAPLAMLAAGITMKQAIKVSKRFEKKHHLGKIFFLVIIIAMSGLQVFLASFMPSFLCIFSAYLVFILFHNFLFGFFVGALFLTSVSECQKYFEKRKLLVTSIVLIGGGLGCVFFGLLNIHCMNPYSNAPANAKYYYGNQDYIAYSMPHCMKQMSYFIWIIGVIGCAMLIPIIRYNNNEVVIEYRIKTQKNFENQCHSEGQALKSRIFWVIGAIIILGSAGNFFVTMNYKNIPSSTIHNQEFLAIVALSGMVGNGFFRFIWGGLIQKIGFKWSFLSAMVLNIFSFTIMPFAIRYYHFYLMAYTISGIVAGGLMVLMTNLSLLVFGEIGNQMFGYMWGGFTIANFLQYFMGATIAQVIPHTQLILFFAATSFIALVISSLTTYQGRWQNSLDKLEY